MMDRLLRLLLLLLPLVTVSQLVLGAQAERCPGSCLFISEYVEAGPGSSNNFLELYNGCLQPTDLGKYRLMLCRDGCPRTNAGHTNGPWTGAVLLNIHIGSSQTAPTLQPGASFVIAYCETEYSRHCADYTVIAQSDAWFRDMGDGSDAVGVLYKV